MSGTINGLHLCGRSDTTVSRCLDIIERGMARMKLTAAPASFNRMMVADEPCAGHHARIDRLRAKAVAGFLAEYRATSEKTRSVGKIARAHRLGLVPARQALIEAGLIPAYKTQKALVARKAGE